MCPLGSAGAQQHGSTQSTTSQTTEAAVAEKLQRSSKAHKEKSEQLVNFLMEQIALNETLFVSAETAQAPEPSPSSRNTPANPDQESVWHTIANQLKAEAAETLSDSEASSANADGGDSSPNANVAESDDDTASTASTVIGFDAWSNEELMDLPLHFKNLFELLHADFKKRGSRDPIKRARSTISTIMSALFYFSRSTELKAHEKIIKKDKSRLVRALTTALTQQYLKTVDGMSAKDVQKLVKKEASLIKAMMASIDRLNNLEFVDDGVQIKVANLLSMPNIPAESVTIDAAVVEAHRATVQVEHAEEPTDGPAEATRQRTVKLPISEAQFQHLQQNAEAKHRHNLQFGKQRLSELSDKVLAIPRKPLARVNHRKNTAKRNASSILDGALRHVRRDVKDSLIQVLVLQNRNPLSFLKYYDAEKFKKSLIAEIANANVAEGRGKIGLNKAREIVEDLRKHLSGCLFTTDKKDMKLADKICSFLSTKIDRQPTIIGDGDLIEFKQTNASYVYDSEDGVWTQNKHLTPTEVVQKACPDETLGNFFAIESSDGKLSFRSNNIGSPEKCVTLQGSVAVKLVENEIKNGATIKDLIKFSKRTHRMVSTEALDLTFVKGLAGGKTADELGMFNRASAFLKSLKGKPLPYKVRVNTPDENGEMKEVELTIKISHDMISKPVSDYRTGMHGIIDGEWKKSVAYNRKKYMIWGKMLAHKLDKKYKTSKNLRTSKTYDFTGFGSKKAKKSKVDRYNSHCEHFLKADTFDEFVRGLDKLHIVKEKLKKNLGLYKKKRDKLEAHFVDILKKATTFFFNKCSSNREKNALNAVIHAISNCYTVSHDGKEAVKLRDKRGHKETAFYGSLSTINDDALFDTLGIIKHKNCKSGQDRTAELIALEKASQYIRRMGIDVDVVRLFCTQNAKQKAYISKVNRFLKGDMMEDGTTPMIKEAEITPKNKEDWLLLMFAYHYNKYKNDFAASPHNISRAKGKALKTTKHPIDKFLGLRFKNSQVHHTPRGGNSEFFKGFGTLGGILRQTRTAFLPQYMDVS